MHVFLDSAGGVRCLSLSGASCYPHGCFDAALQAVLSAPRDCVYDSRTMAMIKVINNYPENRYTIPLHHLDHARTTIIAIVCDVVKADEEGRRLVFTAKAGPP